MQRTVKASLSLLRIQFADSLQYRAAALAGASIGIFWAAIEITVYSIFYNHGNLVNSSALSLPQLISYIWLGQVIFPLNQLRIDPELRRKIVSGDVALELCRPLDFYIHWFMRSTAARLSSSWGRSAFILIAALIPGTYRLLAPASTANLLFFGFSLLSSFLPCSAYAMLSTAIRLRITWGDGPTYMIELLGMILGGGYLPLQLWPDSLQRILLLQPFAGYLDIPVRLYIGSMPLADALPALGLQIFWTAFFILLGRWLMQRNLHSIVVQGG